MQTATKIVLSIIGGVVVTASVFGTIAYFKSVKNSTDIASVYDQSVINLCSTINKLAPDRYEATQGGCSIKDVVKK